jgi:hypothetical protein
MVIQLGLQVSRNPHCVMLAQQLSPLYGWRSTPWTKGSPSDSWYRIGLRIITVPTGMALLLVNLSQ